MKKFLFFLLLCPLLLAAQNKARFENDTLYTSCGFKIYEGQTLQFGKATGWNGFRYIVIKNGVPARSLENISIVVKNISKYGTTPTGTPSIDVSGSIVYRDGSKGSIVLSIAFDKAIGNLLPGISSELIVPEEFRITTGIAATLNQPAFLGDTLYTSCGYKIYKGQLLQFGKATAKRARFRYVNVKNGVQAMTLQNHQVKVKELKDFALSALGNAYISIIGTLMINNNERGDIVIHMAFDHAIENIPGVPSELLVPDEFRNRPITDPGAEVDRLQDLYRDGVISQEEFEALRKKLVGQ